MEEKMKKLIIVVASVLLLSFSVNAQPLPPDTLWTRTYGGSEHDYERECHQTEDGGYIIVGSTESYGYGDSDVYLIKTDMNGDTIWTSTYGSSNLDQGNSVQQTLDGGYIIAGLFNFVSGFGGDVYLIKTNSVGDTIWTRTYGGSEDDQGWSVKQTLDGGYIIAGLTQSFGAIYGDVYLIKTNSNGDTLWTKTYGGPNHDAGMDVKQTLDGGYIVIGTTNPAPIPVFLDDIYVLKTDSSGDSLWTQTYGGEFSDSGGYIQQTQDGGYIIVGNLGSAPFPNCLYDVYLIKINADGDTIWTRTYGGNDWDGGKSVQQTVDGGFIIAGYTISFGSGGSDAYIIKTDANGDSVWTLTLGGVEDDIGNSIKQTEDDRYIIAGTTYSYGAGLGDVWLIRLDSEGSFIEDFKLHTPFEFTLHSPYPNPFNPTTTITFSLPRPEKVQIAVYDILGRRVAVLADGFYPAGFHNLQWDASNQPSGIYFARLSAENFHQSRKLLLIK